MILSIGAPGGRYTSTCGYCSPPGERSAADSFRNAASLVAFQISNEVYQIMINRGWRRSGKYCYKPHLLSSCCPPYTIKLDVTSFKPSKHHKKLLNRWNNLVQYGDKEERDNKRKGRDNAEFNLLASVHASDFCSDVDQGFVHRYEMTLEPCSYTDEKYELFKKYQSEIHHDPSTPAGFERFLVSSPLQPEIISYQSSPPSHLPKNYGSYHWCYRLDGKLIAVSVIDILPQCVSSVYFMYDKDYESHSLGKLSVLRETALAQELHAAGASSLRALYLGYYIHSCQKMRYKGEYQPSYLCDPETYEWYPLADCLKPLMENRYSCFTRPEHSIGGEPDQQLVRDFECYAPQEPDEDTLQRIKLVSSIKGSRVSVIPADLSPEWNDPLSRKDLLCCVEELGIELASKIIFQL
ncbi:arginine-tRNA-protein transferase [Rhodocollybia butyracea]|uniref:arginyltransferase n=1 Tax=Rhodocollybia butyracea TaxID=206335 RepID=A0A9P5UE77_9AGAR|nr:arginine-tRNA-protein transferase [Rhodocollybia butyracea]